MQEELRLNYQDQFSDCSDEDEDVEDCRNYAIGCFHPVFVGEVFHGRYVTIQKLEFGHLSTIWLAKDFKTNNFVALRFQRSAPRFQEAALNEIEILQTIHKKSKFINIVKLLHVFLHKGPFGQHYVLVFEMLGVNLLRISHSTEDRGLNFDQCKSIIKQILIALDFLHRECGIIHADLKPENIRVCLTNEQVKELVDKGQITQRQQFQDNIKHYQKQSSSDKKKEKRKRQKEKKKLQCIKQKLQWMVGLDKRIFQVKIVDFSKACWINHHNNDKIQTLQYRAPEVIMGQFYTTSADIWSLACIAFELITGDSLFDIENDDELTHLAYIQQVLGPFPIEFTCVGKDCKKYFSHNGVLKHFKVSEYYTLEQILVQKYQINKVEANQFADFLQPMLNVIPYKRATASQMLKHPWISKQQFKFYYFVEQIFIDDEHEIDEEDLINNHFL
ncbi:unnamed protein product [Paramecium pentaurelia]|uniref:non-specific serine/threonine protein kinase n=1 Tax=Paramecium pentaurelia TaxID=43138 RepID=A0A8S1T560_9CILI|nr:unnamed protein product [Paramecium pentaurelia]